MRRIHRIAIAMLLATIPATGCGSDGNNRTLDDVCDADTGLFVEFVDKALDCQEGLALIFGSLPTASDTATACHGQFDGAFADGTMELSDDSAVWDACLAFIDGLDCTTFDFDGPNPCADVFVGSQPDGEACDIDEQCVGSAYCDDSGNTACGVCAALRSDGTSCTDDEQCLNGWCDSTCETRSVLGDACTQEGDECGGNLRCGDGDTCEVAKVWAAGDSCDPENFGEQCGFIVSDLVCDRASSTCKPYAKLGDTCGQGASVCAYKNYEICENQGANAGDTCVAGTTVGDGQACSMFMGMQCSAGLVCSNPFENGTCGGPYEVGDSCTEDCGRTLFLECLDNVCGYSDYSGECPTVVEAL